MLDWQNFEYTDNREVRAPLTTKKVLSWLWHLTASNGETPVLEIWEVWTTPSSLAGPLWPRGEIPVKAPSFGQIELFKNYL